MKISRMLYVSGVIVLSVLAVLFTSCSNPVTTAHHSISGVISDQVTGAPIDGATVVMGKYSATTDAAGKYTIALDADSTSVTGNFAVSKGTDYMFDLVQNATLNASSDPSNFNVSLRPAVAPSATVTLSGTITKNQTAIPANSAVSITIVNQNGGSSIETATYSGGYSIATPTTGANCLLVVAISYPTGSPDVFYLTDQDISTSSSSFNLQVPSSGATSVAATGVVSGASSGLGFVVPGYGTVVGYTATPTGTSFDVSVYNPDNFQVFLAQSEVQTANAPATLHFAISAPQALSASPSLPPFNLTPTTTYDDITTSTTYGYNNGTLTFKPSSDPNVNLHLVQLIPTDASGNQINQMTGILWLTSGSVTLPASIQSVISSELKATAGNYWGIALFASEATGLSMTSLFGLTSTLSNGGAVGATDFEIAAAAGGATDVVPDFIHS